MTNRSLEDAVEKAAFRADLYDRLLVGRIEVPALRERRSDIPLLADHFIAKAAKELTLPAPPFIVQDALNALVEYDWPGNVRELENVVMEAILEILPYAVQVILVRDLRLNELRKRARADWSGGAEATGLAQRPAPTSASMGSTDGGPMEHLVAHDAAFNEMSPRGQKARSSRPTKRRRYQRPPDRDVERANIRRALEQTTGNRRAAAHILNMARSYLYEKIKEYGLDDLGRE